MKNRSTCWRFVFAVLAIFTTALLAMSLALPLSAYAATPTPTPVPLQGDLNFDGRIDCLDLILLQICLNTPPSSCDIDGNNKTNTADRTLLFNIILGKVTPTGGGGGGGGGGGPIPTPQNTVYFNNSSYAKTYGPGAAGQNFTARVLIGNTNYLYNGTFTVSYNSSLLQMNNVSDGNFSGKDIPMNGSDWSNNASTGVLTIMPNLSAYINMSSNTSDGISGSGYLCDIQFQTNGSGTSPLTINGTLNQRKTGNFSAISGTTWTNSSVVITQYYSLNVSSEAHGTIISPAGNFSYPKGTVVGINATATDPCWQFSHWEGNDTSSIVNVNASNDVIRMNNSYTISANFSIKTFTLSVVGNNSGGTPTFEGISPFTCGTTVNLSANTNSCYTFAGWTPTEGIADPSAENTTALMNKSRSLTAHYNIKHYTLTIDAAANGSTNLSVGDHTYNCSTVVKVLSNASECYVLTYWLSSDPIINGSTADPVSITMNESKTLTPVFAISDTFTLSVNAIPTEGGTPTANGSIFNCGDYAAIHANTSTCYDFVNWTGTAVDAGRVANASAPDTTVLMRGNYILTAHYTIKTFALSVNASPTAGGTPTGSGTYNCGANASVSANTSSCYDFVNWTSSGSVSIANSSATTTNVTVNGVGTVTANYAIKQFYLTVTANDSDGGTPTGSGTYNCGANASVSANTSSCYNFINWTSSGSVSIANSSATTTNVTVNGVGTVTANYAIKTFALSVTANNSGGTPTFEGISPFTCGTTVNLSANTNSCYTFTGWTPTTGITNPNAENTTVLMNATRTLTAHYNIKHYTLTIDAAANGSTNLSVGDHTYNCSTVVNVLSNASECYVLTYWLSSDPIINGSTADPIIITMNESKTLAPVFAISNTFTLSVNASPTEGGSPTANGSIFNCGDYAAIHANTSTCYDFVNWTGTAVDAGKVANASAPDTTVLMRGNYILTAHYTIKTFALSVNASPIAGGSPTGAGTYNCSANASISANASSCYDFINWSSSGSVSIANSSAATTNVTMNGVGTVTAHYTIKQYTLTTNVLPAEAAAAGCNVSGAATYNCSENATVQANEAGRYIFDHWSGGLSGSTNPDNVTMNADTNVTANFVPIPMVYFETVGIQTVGTPFSIKVLVDNISYMAYATFDIRFNGSLLSYNSINTTSIIGDGTGTATKGPSGDSEIVRIDVDYSSYASAHDGDGVSGSGILCTLNFSPLAWGTSPLNFVDGQGTPAGELTLVAWEGYAPSTISPVYWEDGSVAIVP